MHVSAGNRSIASPIQQRFVGSGSGNRDACRGLPASGIAHRRTETGRRRAASLSERSEKRTRREAFFPVRETTTASESTRDARAAPKMG